jgi:Mg2+-importing ATPase
VDEATLTGETYPAEKSPGTVPTDTVLSGRTNVLWMGTHVVSGSSKAVAVSTGKKTKFGEVSQTLKLRPPETEFEHGVRQFGYLLMEVTLVLVIVIFAINVYLARPMLDAFLFSLALAVGLTPQLLPAIISINLAHGAKRMASQKVIVKRLASIENFGSMNVLCSDKTGTLTQGTVTLESALDVAGQANDKVLLYAYLNSSYETGFNNPIDEAIRSYRKIDTAGYQKADEIPYDFSRKKLSVLVSKDGGHFMATKGALTNIIDVCSSVDSGGKITDMAGGKEQILKRADDLAREGFRVLGISYKEIKTDRITRADESGMIFFGLLVFADPLKPGIKETIGSLRQLGVSLKIITGDTQAVAAMIGQKIGLSNPVVLSGSTLRQMSDMALIKQVTAAHIFAEIEPSQKERIILALKKAGNVVGYMGDGINDASALHAADVGISVESAVDVAKEAADIVLLEKDLSVLVQGVKEGRVTFTNTLKYVFMATSANFGNMFSMAGASLFLPFLPLLPKQVLMTNLLTDFPEMAIATDSVDAESVDLPRRWNIQFIRKYMIVFGLISSVFDYLTFGALIYLLHSTKEQFRTGWFLESVVSAALIVLVIRTRRPFFKSAPGKYLLIATLSVVCVTLILPFTPLAPILGLGRMPAVFFVVLGVIVVLYMFTAEAAKRIFYKVVKF